MYNLTYDSQNRLTGSSGNIYNEQSITYDRNGNIKTLQRTANNAIKDDIAYQYNGNQLTSVTGNLASTYTYDVNGNLAIDSKKSLQFSYNYLNLLESAGETNYTYAADGEKLSVKNGANGFDYLGSLILSNSSTEFQFSDGVIMKTTGGYDVNYHLRDHLGSVRVVVDKNKNILQQNDYYAFGLKQERADYVNNANRFLYNGKELQTTGDLGLLDYGARMYNADIGRFFTQDRFAEKYYANSSYSYADNNPANCIDINGDSVWYTIKGNQVTMNVTSKIIDYSGQGIDILRAAMDIANGISDAFSGDFEYNGEEYTMDVDIKLEVANSMDDVKESDHLFVLADSDKPLARGATNMIGGKVIHVLGQDYPGTSLLSGLNWSSTRSAVHEFGHALGLEHTRSRNLMQQASGSTKVTPEQRIEMIQNQKFINKGSNFYKPVGNQKVTPYPFLHDKGNSGHINQFGIKYKK